MRMEVSPVQMYLSRYQYLLLFSVMDTVQRIVASSSEPDPNAKVPESLPKSPESKGETTVSWTKLDFAFQLPKVGIELFADESALEEAQRTSLSRFLLTGTSFKAAVRSDLSLSADLVMNAFAISDTRKSASKFK